MKLESTLPTRANFLYSAPVLDVVLLLLIFFLLGSNFILKSGISVEVPFSNSSLPSIDRSHIITLAPGESSRIFFNEDRVTLDELNERLEKNAATDKVHQVIIRADQSATFGSVIEISNLVLRHGYDLVYATSSESGD
ncbi:MAG: biopolymer transporter ExbD [Verrucomicrobiota bacterium]